MSDWFQEHLGDFKLLHWPQFSPDLNPIEHFTVYGAVYGILWHIEILNKLTEILNKLTVAILNKQLNYE